MDGTMHRISPPNAPSTLTARQGVSKLFPEPHEGGAVLRESLCTLGEAL